MSPAVERLNILPNPSFRQHGHELSKQMDRLGQELRAGSFAPFLDPVVQECLETGFAEAGADEGTVWMLDETGEALTPAFNTGPRAAEVVCKFKQPLNSGLICMVYASEQPFMENEVWLNRQQSRVLDSLLKLQTCAMIAVPLYLLRGCRGVISCVQLRVPNFTGPPPSGFDSDDLHAVQRVAALVSHVVDYRVLSRVVGWECL